MSQSTNPQALTAETTFLLPSPAGHLEVLFAPSPEPSKPITHLAIICHPHPLFGGTMTNKVVTTLSKSFQQLNLPTIRFNFRGVGQSTGTYANGQGEQEDLLTILAWARANFSGAAIWLAGFSFGAFISIRTAAQQPFAGLVSIAPPVNNFSLAELPEINCPWIVVQGEQDEVVPFEAVRKWVAELKQKPIFIPFAETGHFFHGKLTELKETVVEWLKGFIAY